MTKRALITGCEGFVGRVLWRHLADHGWEVLGCDRSVPEGAPDKRACDLAREDATGEMLAWAGDVSHVFHLAAITFVPDAMRTPRLTFDINLDGTIGLAHLMGEHTKDARLVFVGSAEVYGPPDYVPTDEAHPLRPQNPYAISKAAADQYCRYLHGAQGRDIVIARPFNHSGPGQSPDFVLSSFAQQMARIDAGLQEPVLRVGNLEAARDFGHVRDVVRAYEQLALHGVAGEAYNVCTGTALRLDRVVDKLRERIGRDVRVETDPERMRPVDVPEVRGSYAKLRAATGWQPEISSEELFDDLLAYWRAEVSG